MTTVTLLRHGESSWNQENRFTGWTDVDLSSKGRQQAPDAGRILNKHGLAFEVAYTSVLKRAIRTLWSVLDEMELMWIPVDHWWRLNERHYRALQGSNKSEIGAKFGEGQVKFWRRSFDVRPPKIEPDDQRHPGHDPRYRHVRPDELPLSESLKDTALSAMALLAAFDCGCAPRSYYLAESETAEPIEPGLATSSAN